MPRIARNNSESEYFHLIVQGIEKHYIFNRNIYKEKYKEFLYKYCEEFKIVIIAYCIMDNHVHILVHIKNIADMSKFMHKVNLKYAQFYNFVEDNRVGYVFRNRFVSEPILNEDYLFNCIKYIHNNPVKANIVKTPNQYKYSSYNEYIKENPYNTEEKMECYIFADVDIDSRDIIIKLLEKYKILYNIDLTKLKDKSNRINISKFIIELKHNYKISYKEISEELNISLSTVNRLARENDMF